MANNKMRLERIPIGLGLIGLKNLPAKKAFRKLERSSHKLGLIKAGASILRDIMNLGVGVDTVGPLQMAKGYSVMTQQMVANAMLQLNTLIENAESDEVRERAIYALGYLAKRMSDVTLAVRTIEAEEKSGVKTLKRSFVPLREIKEALVVEKPVDKGKGKV